MHYCCDNTKLDEGAVHPLLISAADFFSYIGWKIIVATTSIMNSQRLLESMQDVA